MKRAWIVVLLLLGAYAFVLYRHTCFVAGGSDSSGYLNEARLIAAGRLHVPIDPLDRLKLSSDFADVFCPLGFSASGRTMVPTYPAGVPFHLAPAALVGGWSVAPFVVVPLAAIGCLFLIYLLARQLGLERPWGVAAAAVLAACPVFLLHAIQPVSDVLATFWALAAMVCALRARSSPALAAAAGVAFAIGVWVRPNNILMALPLAIALMPRPSRLLLAAAAGLPLGIALMVWNKNLYGTAWATGYGSIQEMMAWSYIRERAPRYTIWLASMLTPLVFPGALLVALDRRVSAAHRWLLLIWIGAFFLFFCFYRISDAWFYTRFLLPAIPAMIIAALLLIRDFAPRPIAILLVAAILVTASVQGKRLGVLSIAGGESIYPQAVQWAERRLPHDALLVAMQHSGAFYYYSGRFTAQWSTMDNDRFQLLRAYAADANMRWYALLHDFELPEFHKRLQGRWTAIDKYREVTLLRLEE